MPRVEGVFIERMILDEDEFSSNGVSSVLKMNKLVPLVLFIGVVTALDGSSDTSSSSSESSDSLGIFNMFDNEYFSSEAKEAAGKLEKYLFTRTGELQFILDELEKDNSAVDALKNYHSIVKSSENTKCKVETPKGLAIAEDTITSAADMCADSVSIDDFDSVAGAVEKTFDEIKNIDKRLRENDKLCSSEKSADCAKDKKKAIDDLKSILSPTVIDNFDNLIYSEAKEALDVCLHIVTEDLQLELDMHTRKIKECLTSHQNNN